jgi:uncharacterized membrane protein YphA (DoxX/SURF4 family)
VAKSRARAKAAGGAPPRAGAQVAPGASHVPRAVALALLVLRLYAGAFFVDATVFKTIDQPRALGIPPEGVVAHFRDGDYVPMVEAAIADPPRAFGVPLTPYADFLRAVMLPAADVFAPAILVAEALLGLSLVLGAGVRLSAGLGALMMLAFSLAKYDRGEHIYFLTVHSNNWAMTLILVALSLAAAGRFLGIDAWARRAGPRWLCWTA